MNGGELQDGEVNLAPLRTFDMLERPGVSRRDIRPTTVTSFRGVLPPLQSRLTSNCSATAAVPAAEPERLHRAPADRLL